MTSGSTMALVAHDGMKNLLIDWSKRNKAALEPLTLFATGTTGGRLTDEVGLTLTALKSGPKGGDAQLGAMIAEGRLDALVFFIDPLSALPHDVDVKSLLRLAILYDTQLAVNESTANAVLANIR
ncbi:MULTISPECIES: methylglyoxal synthase [Halocynthiibacter]|uniref:Methylglyoxal synthase n=2 Tax=Halocynthiibacter TaxID=1579315 RepID=A0AAE3IYQ2_9RHOB|nr:MULTISPECIES: methylglyoxal synthase [Halocynthiibacter]MCV6823580.1 methylglyoxal synthase [Halocynthiibacter halioticoli]MCW4056581.1 methylglyoxal synthase [Halocynthiibacter sp. SDUM655004]